jgi:hypothetical protein
MLTSLFLCRIRACLLGLYILYSDTILQDRIPWRDDSIRPVQLVANSVEHATTSLLVYLVYTFS